MKSGLEYTRIYRKRNLWNTARVFEKNIDNLNKHEYITDTKTIC